MEKSGRKVCVIGAGTMGSGIAAHLANIGFSTTLLDLSDASVQHGFDRARKARPPHFYIPETADLVRLGTIEHAAAYVTDADWVCEAIVEKLDAKRALFAAIEPFLKPDAFVSTNTSGLQIGLLAEGRSAGFRERFLGTHFFNPPRYLKLLELIPTPETSPNVVSAMHAFLEGEVARRVVLAKDTPGFIANRYGMWCMYHATHCAERLGLTVEQVDAITGPFLGRPRTGSFRLNDLVGLDIMEDIAHNLLGRCPDDPQIKALEAPRSLSYLFDKGWMGEKSGQGYYRREGREVFSFDLLTLAYRMRLEPELASLESLGRLPFGERLRAALELRDEVGEFLRAYLVPALDYADHLKEEISNSPEDFDRVMMWGFGWQHGPFAMRDILGLSDKKVFDVGNVLGFDGQYRPADARIEYWTASDYPLVEEREGFRIRDMGDGVRLLATTTKMGVFSRELVDSLSGYLAESLPGPIVLTSEARSFSAGFDLQFLLTAALEKDFDAVERSLDALQQLGMALGRLPSVAAVFGFCLGGGYEMATSCSVVAAHPETQMGLPEAKVGLVPGGGGAAHTRLRHQTNAKSIVDAAKALVTGVVSANADDARKHGYLRPDDVTVYHPDRLLAESKRLALAAATRRDAPWAAVGGPVAGMVDAMLTELRHHGEISEHDQFIGEQLKQVLAKATSFEDALARERRAFHDLLAEGLTVARIRHMLDTGKPLKN